MNFKELIKRKGFWAGFSGICILIAQLLGLKVQVAAVNEIISAVCSVLVVAGLLTLREKEDIDAELSSDFEQGTKEETDSDEDEDNG